jgi:hypothetical protein
MRVPSTAFVYSCSLQFLRGEDASFAALSALTEGMQGGLNTHNRAA